MSIWSGIAVYFIIWWVVLFAVLPWGIQNAHEAGEAIEVGNEPGAPVKPRLLLKVLITTIISALVFAVVYAAISSGWVLG
jgi:predicted secreted protein